MLISLGYFTAFFIPVAIHTYALMYRKQKKTKSDNILVLSLPLAISAEAMGMYGFSLRYESIIWVAWILIACAFGLLSFAVDDCNYADVVTGTLNKFGLNRNPSKISNFAKGKTIIAYRLLLTLLSILVVCTALHWASVFSGFDR